MESIIKDNLTQIKKGNWYFCYDDGNITFTGLSKLKILEVIPFNEASKSLVTDWYRASRGCCLLFTKKTPCFLRTKIIDNCEPPVYFALMDNKNCFYSFQRRNNSFWNSNFLLDIDGEFTKNLIKEIKFYYPDYYEKCNPDYQTKLKQLKKDYVEWKKQFKKKPDTRRLVD